MGRRKTNANEILTTPVTCCAGLDRSVPLFSLPFSLFLVFLSLAWSFTLSFHALPFTLLFPLFTHLVYLPFFFILCRIRTPPPLEGCSCAVVFYIEAQHRFRRSLCANDMPNCNHAKIQAALHLAFSVNRNLILTLCLLRSSLRSCMNKILDQVTTLHGPTLDLVY